MPKTRYLPTPVIEAIVRAKKMKDQFALLQRCFKLLQEPLTKFVPKWNNEKKSIDVPKKADYKKQMID